MSLKKRLQTSPMLFSARECARAGYSRQRCLAEDAGSRLLSPRRFRPTLDVKYFEWWPLIELTRLRHLRFRAALAAGETSHRPGTNVVAAGV
jgi:hypothetical protein